VHVDRDNPVAKPMWRWGGSRLRIFSSLAAAIPFRGFIFFPLNGSIRKNAHGWPDVVSGEAMLCMARSHDTQGVSET